MKMADLIGHIAKYFKLNESNIDNLFFKLFYHGTFILFFGGSMLGAMSQYFGDPINCDFKGVNNIMATDYCWIHGSSHFPGEYQQHMMCIVDMDHFNVTWVHRYGPHLPIPNDGPDTSYYQWVTFVLLLQAGSFVLPYKLWSIMEGGLIQSFGK